MATIIDSSGKSCFGIRGIFQGGVFQQKLYNDSYTNYFLLDHKTIFLRPADRSILFNWSSLFQVMGTSVGGGGAQAITGGSFADSGR